MSKNGTIERVVKFKHGCAWVRYASGKTYTYLPYDLPKSVILFMNTATNIIINGDTTMFDNCERR